MRRWVVRGIPVVGALCLLWVGWLVFKPEGLATDGPTGPLALYNGEWSGDDAAMGGTLVIDERCLYVENTDPGGTKRWLVAFGNRGTSWDEESHSVHLPWGTFRNGDQIQFGGGEGGDPASLNWAVPPDPSCDMTRWWVAGR